MSTAILQIESDLLFHLIPESGSLALDIGANQGFWSRELTGRFGIVDAYEPQAGLTDAPGATVRNVAVGARRGTATMRLYRDSEHATMVPRADHPGYGPMIRTLPVAMVALDDIYDGTDIDFLKVDVEGAEVEVLKGARKILATGHPEWIIEIHGLPSRAKVLELTSNYTRDIIKNPIPGADPDYCWIHAH